MRSDLMRGVVAGFVATLAMSVLMLIKAATQFAPDVDIVALLSGFLNAPMWVGWIAHFVIGTLILGPLFALLSPRLPGSTVMTRGVIFAVGVWLFMQLVVLKVVGAGFFGIGYGFAAPVITFVLHILYGIVLGATYDKLHGHWHEKKAADNARGALRYTHY